MYLARYDEMNICRWMVRRKIHSKMGTSMEKNQSGFLVLSPRERLSYTRHQLQLLNGIFERVRYPNSIQKQIIATRVGINREQVKVWFQNRRRKEVVGKQKMSTESRVDKSCKESPAFSHGDSTSYTPLSSSSQPKSVEKRLIPTVVLTSIIYELERFNNDKYGGRKTHIQLSRGENNHVITDDNQDSDGFEIADDNVRTECFKMADEKKDQHIKNKSPKTSLCNSRNQYKKKRFSQSTKSSKNNIFISAYDIKSPPNQITPTAIFTLRNDDRSNQPNIGASSWMFRQLEEGLANNFIDRYSNQRNSNSLTDLQNFKNDSFAELSSPSLHGRNHLYSFEPKSSLNSNYASVVSFSPSDSYTDQMKTFPVADLPTLNDTYGDRFLKFHQSNFPDFRSPATSQQLLGPPHIYQNIHTFPFSYNRDF